MSYWHLCLSIVVGRLWETQSPVRCAKWDPTYNIMYAGSMCLQPRQLCYYIATNQSFAKWNRNKEKLHLFPISSLFRKLWKMFESFSESTGPKWRNLKCNIYREKENNVYYCVHDFLPRGNKTNEKIDVIFEIKMVKLTDTTSTQMMKFMTSASPGALVEGQSSFDC